MLLVIWIISAHGCILSTYPDIPNNDFGLPKLDYLHTQASFGMDVVDIPRNDSGLPTLDYSLT